MAELERALERIAADVDWPATPPLVLRRRRRRWPLAVALAAALAVGAAFAVPQSRGALLRFFHLGGVSIERVDTLPPAALRTSLGSPIDAAAARRLLGRPFAVADVRLYRTERVVSAVVDGSLLFSEVRTNGDYSIVKKFYGAGTSVKSTFVDGDTPALWVSGAPHVVVIPPALPPRYAGNTLVWVRGPITYRLEGHGLTLERAKAIADGLG